MLLLLWTLLVHSALASTLTFKDCIQAAYHHNPDLLSAEASLQSQEEVLLGSYSGFFPSLSTSIGVGHYSPKLYAFDPRYTSALSASYNLFSGLKDRAKVHQAEANLEIARANVDSLRANVSYSLRQALAQFLYARDNVNLTLLIRERRAQNERLVRAQYESGNENQGSYLLSKSLVDQADYERQVAKDQLQITSQNLSHVLGFDTNDFEFEGEVPQLTPPKEIDAPSLLEMTPDHRTQLAKIRLAEGNREVSRAGFMPSLDLSASLSFYGPNPTWSQNHQVSTGLTLTIPLFSGLSTFRDYRNNQFQVDAAGLNQVSGDFATLSSIRQGYFAFQESIAKLKVDLDTLSAATIRATISRKRYNTGLLTFEQWDLIETDLINRQKNALSSKRDRIIAESNYRQSIGLGDLP